MEDEAVPVPEPSEEPSSGEKVSRPVLKRVRPSKAIRKRENVSPQHMDGLWKALDAKIGGRNGFLEAALASQNPKAALLVELLLDSSYQSWGTKKLAKKAGLSTSEIVDMFKDKKWLQTTMELYEALPDIVKGAAEDAKPQYVPCDECKGQPIEPPCYRCKGSGELRRPGDKDKTAFIGEAAGLVGKRGPAMQTNIQINTQNQTVSTSFEELMRKSAITIKQIEGSSHDKE